MESGLMSARVVGDNTTFHGMGYSNMLSRVSSIKGRMDVESSPESGTKVLIRVKI